MRSLFFKTFMLSALCAGAQSVNAEFARLMPGFPVKTSVIDQEISRNPAAVGIAQLLIKNISNVKQTGEVAFDNWAMVVSIHVANCNGDDDGDSLDECCGSTAATKKSWLADADAWTACKKRFNITKSCDLPPLINGDCKYKGQHVINTASATRGASPWEHEGKWVQSADPHYSVFRAAKRYSENSNVRIPNAFLWEKNEDGKLELEFKRDRGSRAMTADFKVSADSNVTVGRRVFCGFTKTGLSCATQRPANYSSTLPGCRRNSNGKIVDLEPCIARATVNLDFDFDVGVNEDRGAIMGSYYGMTHIYGSGEADRDRVNIPLNSGLPF